MAKMPDKIIEKLMNARKAATLQTASFGFPTDKIQIVSEHFGRKPGTDLHPDAYIKEKVALHHQTWIIAEIDAVLVWALEK